jgi:hypothetical protein
MKHLLLLLVGLALSYASVASEPGSFRCKGRIIRVGDPAALVLSLCGQPANQVVQESVARAATLTGGSRLAGIALSEQWLYERGWGRFPAVLVLLDGNVKRIDFLRYRS